MSSIDEKLSNLAQLSEQDVLVVDFEGAADRTPLAVGVAIVDSSANVKFSAEFFFHVPLKDYNPGTLKWWESNKEAHDYILQHHPKSQGDNRNQALAFLTTLHRLFQTHPDAVVVADAAVYDWGVMMDAMLRMTESSVGAQKVRLGQFSQPYELHSLQLLVDVPNAPDGMHSHKPADDCVAIAWRWRAALNNAVTLLAAAKKSS